MRRYLFPIVLAVFVHVLLVVIGFASWEFSNKEIEKFKIPEHINVSVIELAKPKKKVVKKVVPAKPKEVKKVEGVPPEKVIEKSESLQKTIDLDKDKKKKEKAKEDQERKDRELAAKKLKEKKERDDRIKAAMDSAMIMDELLDDEIIDIPPPVSHDPDLLASYAAVIRGQIEDKWNPMQADRPLTARLEIKLLPTGEMTSSRIIKSSGDNQYDQSLLNATQGIYRYKMPKDAELIKEFRINNITFVGGQK